MAQTNLSRMQRYPGPMPDDAVWFSADGLHLGKLRIADRPVRVGEGNGAPADPLEIILALAFDTRLTPGQRGALAAAASASRSFDQATANIRLTHAGLARISSPRAFAQRLDAAALLLERGTFADDLLSALDLRADALDFRKNDPGQPRVPAGHGRQSGEFGSGGTDVPNSTSAAAVRTVSVAGAVAYEGSASPSFLASTVSAEALAALSTFAGSRGHNRRLRHALRADAEQHHDKRDAPRRRRLDV